MPWALTAPTVVMFQSKPATIFSGHLGEELLGATVALARHIRPKQRTFIIGHLSEMVTRSVSAILIEGGPLMR